MAKRYWQIKSSKQHIRLWFEFLKLAKQDPNLEENFERSREFYAPWGDVTPETMFDPWWSEHKHLFSDNRVLEVSKASKRPNVINIQVPLDVSVSVTLKEVKKLIEEKQEERMRELGIDPTNRKSKAVPFGTYHLTAGPEFDGKAYNGILLVYQYWIDLGQPKPINDTVIDAIRAKFDQRAKAATSDRPNFTVEDRSTPDKKGNLRYREEVIRQYRRYIIRGIETAKAVSFGRFPK
ncbi:hypothetical protein JQU17_20150 [Ponticoccus sp. SC2-23]|uniref:hypothetical protein n=1 Tax=Alexandriicola marinus TaxID=2081710 RepID=UPI000FD863A3|nr:hypothetical protein [Alexandriicola marinus]MBM1222528.1 hypothetical protein [Ponticoccus sp. SC6-9]MBM1227034.1 hypothetical protein [Ponticoccus sp. SC6-15]MBM1231455.1 hypothetical protein [Ponticoccus sp. SC6-38]MBM1236109.1 hypothetical protein [Ponticoccus sp. SC6-45]MBM1240478.1 hypothetical protein [Ponticoccus sp. SC6-49]MBM1245013.1 hypothetical protein [Ponticoccus sp. SC2-64]MBM1249584.1 hypothetical protein [Ponticoccus sp. SC6-42]MBM1253971.1 hypothetical protein [Pontico